MSFNQPNLFGDDQADLFAAAPRPAAKINPQHVINRLMEFEAKMKAAETWPWNDFWVGEYKTRTWPYLVNKLIEIGEPEAAARWKAAIATEAARLDAAGAPPAWQAA